VPSTVLFVPADPSWATSRLNGTYATTLTHELSIAKDDSSGRRHDNGLRLESDAVPRRPVHIDATQHRVLEPDQPSVIGSHPHPEMFQRQARAARCGRDITWERSAAGKRGCWRGLRRRDGAGPEHEGQQTTSEATFRLICSSHSYETAPAP
jgi:hypothetical protein